MKRDMRSWRGGCALVAIITSVSSVAMPRADAPPDDPIPIGFDFDGDGVHDAIRLLPDYDEDQPAIGRVKIYSRATTQLLHSLTGEQGNDLFGISGSSVGGVNGDGRDDLVVGAPLHRSDDVPLGRC